MKWLYSLLLLFVATVALSAISTEEKYLLNNKMGAVAAKVQLGTLIQNAETGGLAAGSVGTTELGADAVTNAKIADGAVSLEHLDSGIAPAYFVKYAGAFTTLGGDASESITVSGLTTSDICMVEVKTAGVTPRSIVASAAGTGAIAVTLSGDPSTDHVLKYVCFRAAS
jgi:hypothetical protein